MKLPRDLSGDALAVKLATLGYTVTRRRGDHVRLTTAQGGEHHITIPSHNPLKVGTLSSILHDVADHFKIPREELLRKLFERA